MHVTQNRIEHTLQTMAGFDGSAQAMAGFDGSAQEMMETCQKDRKQLEETPRDQIWDSLSRRINIYIKGL